MSSDLVRLRERITNNPFWRTATGEWCVSEIDRMLAASPAPDAEEPEIVVTERMVDAGEAARRAYKPIGFFPQEYGWVERQAMRAALEAALRQREG